VHLDRVNVVLTDDWRTQVDSTDQGLPLSRREYEHIDAFANAVQAFLGRPVRISEVDSMTSIEESLIICEEEAIAPMSEKLSLFERQILPCVFLLNVSLRPRSIELVERLGAAGAIERMRYAVWRDEREDDPTGGVIGRKDVATSMGARWQPSTISETPRYAFLEHDEHPTLPDLLASYLLSYSKML
jgi:hypothetical protein